MNYGIVRVQKISSSGVTGIQIHDKRAKDSKTNLDIDSTRFELNYTLDNNSKGETYRSIIKNRISQLDLKWAVRKDAVVMVQVLVISDTEFFENLNIEEQKQFFNDSFDFLKERYGEENIVSCAVHLDEKTPHMHFNFIPITEDGRLCAKDFLTPKTLPQQHDLFYQEVGKKYGLSRGEKGGNKKHLETNEFKELTKKYENLKLQSFKQEADNRKLVQARYNLSRTNQNLKTENVTKYDLSCLQGKFERLDNLLHLLKL